MENRVKLSDYRCVYKYKYINGVAEKVENAINGEVEFYSLDSKELDKIQNIIKKAKNKKLNEVQVAKIQVEYFVELIKGMTNIEIDLTNEEIFNMFLKTNDKLHELQLMLMNHIKYLGEMSQNSTNIINKMGEIFKTVKNTENEKTKEDRLEEIKQELETCENLAIYKELQAEKEDIEAELESENE